MSLRLERRGSTIVVVGAAAVYSWVAAGFRPFTPAEEVLVAIPALVALVLAMRAPVAMRTDSSDKPSRGSVAVWLGLVVVAAGWEIYAYLSSPRSAHPTLSEIADNVMSVRPGRALVFALWLALGWVFVRASRAAHP